MKNTIIFLIICFLAAGLWQHRAIADFFKNEVNFSWFSLDETNFAAARAKYMKKGTGPVKIAFISPHGQAHSLIDKFFLEAVNGARIGLDVFNKKKRKGRSVELVVTEEGPGYENVNRSISSLGKDPSVLAVVLPYSHNSKLESEVIAEDMGMMIFHIGHMFGLRNKESYLAMSNTYPFEQFSKKLATYAEKRGVQSVLMLTAKDTVGEDLAKNQDFWFSKKRILVPATFLYEKNMINGPMLEEFKKKLGIFGIDAVYWGFATGENLSALVDAIRQLFTAGGKTENLMFLPFVADNDPAITKLLQHIESSSLDPVIAYPVIADVAQQAAFDSLYMGKFNMKANHAAYYGYDTFMLLSDCLLKDNTASPQDLARILMERNYAGILATYRFTDDGNLDDQVANLIKLGKVKNGVLVEIDVDNIKPLENRKDTGEVKDPQKK